MTVVYDDDGDDDDDHDDDDDDNCSVVEDGTIRRRVNFAAFTYRSTTRFA